LEPEIVEVELGKAEVRKIFFSGKKDMIVGCKVMSGRIENKAKAKVMRGEEEIGQLQIASLRKINEKVDEIKEGNECGIKITGYKDVEEGDILHVYKEEERIRTI
jgi:translation initiation factor IF-2